MPNLATTASYGTTKTLPYAEHFGLNGADVKSHIGAWNTPQFLTAMGNLPLGLLRYAGGTTANTWRWRRSSSDTTFGGYSEQGSTENVNGKSQPQALTLARFKQICDASGAVPVWDLNFACDSTNYGWAPAWFAKNAATNKYDPPNLTDQLALLAAAASLGLPIKYVELGNEFPSFNDGAVKTNYAFPPEGKSTLNPNTGFNYTAAQIPAGYVYDRGNPVTFNANGEDETQLMLGKASTLLDTAFPEKPDVPGSGAAGGGYLYGKRAGVWAAAIRAIYPSVKIIIHCGGPPTGGGLGPYYKQWWTRGLLAGIPMTGSGKPDIIVQHPYHDGNNNYTYGAPNTPPSLNPAQPGYSQAVVDNFFASPDEKWQHESDNVLRANPGTDPSVGRTYWYGIKPLLDAGVTVWNTEYGLLDTVGLASSSVAKGASGVDGGHGGWAHLLSNLVATLIRYNDPLVSGMTLHSVSGSSSATAAIIANTSGLTAQRITATIDGTSVSFPQFRFAGADFPAPGPTTVAYGRTANGQCTAIVSAAAKTATSVKPLTFSGSPKVNDTGATAAGVLGCTFVKAASKAALVTNIRSAPVDVTLPTELASSAYVIHTASALVRPILTPADIISTTGTLGPGTPTITLPPYSVLRVSTTRTATAMVADLNEPVAIPTVTTQVRLATYADLTAGLATVTRTIYPAFSVSGTVAVTSGSFRFYVQEGWTIVATRASVGTAPAGSSLIVDIKKNGTSIFNATTANRPTIAAAANTAVGGTPDTTALVAGDYLTVDVLQVGSSVAGSNLTVQVELQR